MKDRCPQCGVRATDIIPKGGKAYHRCRPCKLDFRIDDPDDERGPILGDVGGLESTNGANSTRNTGETGREA